MKTGWKKNLQKPGIGLQKGGKNKRLPGKSGTASQMIVV